MNELAIDQARFLFFNLVFIAAVGLLTLRCFGYGRALVFFLLELALFLTVVAYISLAEPRVRGPQLLLQLSRVVLQSTGLMSHVQFDSVLNSTSALFETRNLLEASATDL